MLPDDADDLLSNVKDFVRFHKKLGEAWTKARDSVVVKTGIAKHYEMLPAELVDLLDELGGVVRCEEEGCRKPCHGDWDFCEQHGKPKGPVRPQRSKDWECPDCRGIGGVHRMGCRLA